MDPIGREASRRVDRDPDRLTANQSLSTTVGGGWGAGSMAVVVAGWEECLRDITRPG